MIQNWTKVIKTECGDLLVTKSHNDENQPTLVMTCQMEEVGEVSHTVSYVSCKVRDNTYNGMDECTAMAVFKSIVHDVHELLG